MLGCSEGDGRVTGRKVMDDVPNFGGTWVPTQKQHETPDRDLNAQAIRVPGGRRGASSALQRRKETGGTEGASRDDVSVVCGATQTRTSRRRRAVGIILKWRLVSFLFEDD